MLLSPREAVDVSAASEGADSDKTDSEDSDSLDEVSDAVKFTEAAAWVSFCERELVLFVFALVHPVIIRHIERIRKTEIICFIVLHSL